MTHRIVYADNPCAAFLAAMVGSFQKQQTTYLGRTALQKLAYFCKAVGVPIPCSFAIYTYGPYSDTITFSVESLLADEVIVDKSSDTTTYSNYRLGPAADDLFRNCEQIIKPHLSAIDTVVRVFGAFRPEELELIATLHFIAQRLRRTEPKDVTQEQVIREFVAVKGDKFPKAKVLAWYDALKNAKLI